MSGNEFSSCIRQWRPNLHSSSKIGTLLKKIWGCWRKHFCDKQFCRKKMFVNTPNFFSAKCLFWRSCAGLHATIECSSKIHCQTYRFQPSTTLGGGVKKVKTVFVVSFGLKKLIPSSFWNMILWSYDAMIIWYHSNMILWSYDDMRIW